MKRRTIQYLKEMKARKVLQNPLAADLKTFLSATLKLSHNTIVKRDIESVMRELFVPNAA